MEVQIAIIRTHNFSAKLIHIGMWLWALLRKLPRVKTYNHCEVRFGDKTSGAISKGVKTRVWEDYLKSIKKVTYLTYGINLTEEEWKRGYEYLLFAENTPYEFDNFVYHTVKIFTGNWKGSTRTNRQYCYEHVVRFINTVKGLSLDTNLNPYEFKEWADSNSTVIDGVKVLDL